MADQTPDLLEGLGLGKTSYGESDEERDVKRSIAEIFAENPPERSQIAMARMCISLAKNIARGNDKGRAIANEVSTLRDTMLLLEGGDTPDADSLPPEIRNLLDAFAAPAS